MLDVANDVEVKPEGLFVRTDADIALAVRHVLLWDSLVPDERIKSTVSDGWVTLEGDVDFWHQRQDAERTVLRLEGVIGVTNQIKVAPRRVDPIELREEIECALEQRADREAERLRIEVHDGAVDLFGRVHSWQEKRAVIGSISHAPGVTAIRDHLRIDPYLGGLSSPPRIGVTLPQVFDDVRTGQHIWLDDGVIGGVINAVSQDEIELQITHTRPQGNKLRADKGVNLPETELHLRH